jgi:hypothetical protein
LDAFPPPREAHYERLGDYVERALKDELPHEAALTMPAPNRYRTSKEFSLASIEVTGIERHLSRHVGPIAKVLVQRALQSAKNRQSLIDILAGEISNDAARREFVASNGSWVRAPDR